MRLRELAKIVHSFGFRRVCPRVHVPRRHWYRRRQGLQALHHQHHQQHKEGVPVLGQQPQGRRWRVLPLLQHHPDHYLEGQHRPDRYLKCQHYPDRYLVSSTFLGHSWRSTSSRPLFGRSTLSRPVSGRSSLAYGYFNKVNYLSPVI